MRAVVVAERARALAGDYGANLALARLIVAAENAGHEIVAFVDTANWRTAHAMIGNDQADLIIGETDLFHGEIYKSANPDHSQDVPPRQRRPRPVLRD